MSRNTNIDLGGDESYLQDQDVDESLWSSPVKQQSTDVNAPKEAKPLGAKTPTTGKMSYVEQQARDESLRKELAAVRKVNESIEGLIGSLEKAKSNVKVVNRTVGATTTLLNAWTRILSQTEHNQRLILDPSWQGASQDLADMEDEVVSKQQAAERREAEEAERKQATARKAEEEERRRMVQEGQVLHAQVMLRLDHHLRTPVRAILQEDETATEEELAEGWQEEEPEVEAEVDDMQVSMISHHVDLPLMVKDS